MYNPEQLYIEKYTRKEEPLTPGEKIVQEKLVLEHNKKTPQMEDFSDIYSEEIIKQDKIKLKEIKKKMDYYKTERAEILEAILSDQIDQAEWLGECYVTRTTEFDDVINHTDFVVEFEKDDKVHRLAIDVTTSQDEAILRKKGDIIKKEIDNGYLTRLKYFSSQVELLNEASSSKAKLSNRGAISLIPRVIIGVDKEGVQELSQSMAKVIKKEKGGKKELGNHYLQIDFLEQIKKQLEYFIEYAKGKTKSTRSQINFSAIKSQLEILKIIDRTLENKKNAPIVKPKGASENNSRKILMRNFT